MAIVIAHRERRQWENAIDLPDPRVSIVWAIVAKEGQTGAVHKLTRRALKRRNVLATLAPMNRLLFGDNLQWHRDAKLFPDASVDLVYLASSFSCNADYNVLSREASGEASQAPFHPFTDTGNWADAAQTYAEFVENCPNTAVVKTVEALHSEKLSGDK